jgi:hypothetical protein
MRGVKAQASDPLLPKPDRAGPSPAEAGSRPGRDSSGVVRGCPFGTGGDRCEWHACGTAGEDDPPTPWRRWLRLDWRVRAVLGDRRLVGKSPKGSRQLHTGTRLPTRCGNWCSSSRRVTRKLHPRQVAARTWRSLRSAASDLQEDSRCWQV